MEPKKKQGFWISKLSILYGIQLFLFSAKFPKTHIRVKFFFNWNSEQFCLFIILNSFHKFVKLEEDGESFCGLDLFIPFERFSKRKWNIILLPNQAFPSLFVIIEDN